MKKAMSPMVSTLVLIVFAVALGAVVISWGNSEGLSVAADNSCGMVEISYVDIAGVPQVCYDGQNIKAMIKNEGDVGITGVKIVAIGNEGIVSNEHMVTIKAGDVVENSYPLGYSGQIKKVIIEPKIINKLCAKHSIDTENIGVC